MSTTDGDQDIKQEPEVKEEAVDDDAQADEDAESSPTKTDNEPTKGRSTRPRASRGSKSATTAEVKKKKKAKWKPTHPNSTLMCAEAIEFLKEVKGSSGMAIKKYILSTYETVRPDMVNYMVRTALTKGLQTGVFVRPKGDESGGAHGRFKVGKKPDMPKTTYKPTTPKKTSPRKKGTKTKKNERKGRSRKSKKSATKKRKKTRPSTKATLKVKASPKPKRAKIKIEA